MAERWDPLLKVDILPNLLGEYARELEDVDWRILGTHLGLKQSELREIQLDQQNNTGRMRIAMLDKWFSKEENPSWEKIIAALKEMHKTSLASRLTSKYLHKKYQTDSLALETEDQQTTPETELKVHRNDQVSRELDSLKENYLRLKISAETALEKAKPSPRQLRRFSQEYLTNQVLETVKELFDCIGEFCFLDYTLLENTISFFLKEAQKIVSDLSDYIQKLTQFKSSTTLREFMDNIEKAHKSIEGTRVGIVTLRLVGGWLEKTMQDLDKLLKELFQDKKSILAHLRITRGSVLMTYLVPQSEVDALIENTQPKRSFMPQVGVCGLRIGPTPAIIDKIETEVMHFSFESSLISAVKNDDIDIVTFLLDINTNPDSTDDEGQTALMVGSASGQDKAVRLLLNAKADPNFQGHDGVTPLYKAAQNGHSNVVDILLRANANCDILTDDGTTPLDIARQNGHSNVVSTLQKFCISEGATAKPLHFLDVRRKEDALSVSMIMFGRVASGKTSLGSAIVGTYMDKTGWRSSASTRQVHIQVGQGSVNVFDTPGELTRFTDIDPKLFDSKIVVIVCIDMNEQLNAYTLEALALLHKKFGWNIWFRVVIALTKADSYEKNKRFVSKSRFGSNRSVLTDRFAQELIKWKTGFKTFFTDEIGMTEEEVDDLQIPIVPTSQLNKYALERMDQVGYGYWFDQLLIQCCQRVQGFRWLQIHRDRLSQLPPELVRQELGEDMYEEILSKRSRFTDLIPNRFRWQSYCTSVKTMPRFEMNMKIE